MPKVTFSLSPTTGNLGGTSEDGPWALNVRYLVGEKPTDASGVRCRVPNVGKRVRREREVPSRLVYRMGLER